MKKVKSTLILLMTAMIWGFAFVAQRVGAESVGTFTFNGIRFGLGALSLIPVFLIFEREKAKDGQNKATIFYGLMAGVVLFIASNLQQYGILLTASAGKSAFITGLYTVLVPLIYMIFGRKSGLNVWIAAGLTVVGLYLLCGVSGDVGIGDLVLLIGSVFWALHIIILDRASALVRPIRFSSIQFAISSVLGLICAFSFETVTTAGIQAAAVPILYGGLMSTGVAYTCQIIGQKGADPTAAAIVLSTESIWGAVGGMLILDERMSVVAYIGCALIFCGIILSQTKIKSRKKSGEPEKDAG